MEDRMIIKTKKNLKATLIGMMSEIAFEQISITELCKRAEISRITFYSHYSDKYALVDDIFNDMLRIGTDIYHTKQEQENLENNLVIGYCNMLDSILEVYYDFFEFFQYTSPQKNPYLCLLYTSKTGWNDPACNRKRRSDSLDAAGFGTWKYYWTDPGKKRNAADRDRISHCVSGTCFCGKFNRSNDDGFRDHGVNAGYGRQLYTVQSSDVLCDLWRSDGTESCK